MNYMANPSQVLFEYLERLPGKDPAGGWKKWWEYGQLAMALEMVTLIKNLEELPVATDIGRQETISALHTLLQGMGLDVLAWETYDQLCEWRRPKFVADDGVRPEPEPSESGVVVRPLPQDLPGGVSFPRGEPVTRADLQDMIYAEREERRGLGKASSDEQLERLVEEAGGTSTDESK